MPKDPIRSTLEDCGLTDKEVAVYLLLLQLGTAPASTIADKANLPRSTTQFTCQQLTKRGLLRMVQKANTYLFTAEPPERLESLLRRQQEELQEKEQHLQRIIGELKAMQNPNTILPKVQFYEGREQMINLYESVLALESPIDSFEDKGEMASYIPDYVPLFIAARKKKKIWNRVICPSNNPINPNDPEDCRETRTIDAKKFPLSCDIKICKDLVSIFSSEKHTAVGVGIRHAEIADNFRMLFQQMWDLLEKPSRS